MHARQPEAFGPAILSEPTVTLPRRSGTPQKPAKTVRVGPGAAKLALSTQTTLPSMVTRFRFKTRLCPWAQNRFGWRTDRALIVRHDVHLAAKHARLGDRRRYSLKENAANSCILIPASK